MLVVNKKNAGFAQSIAINNFVRIVRVLTDFPKIRVVPRRGINLRGAPARLPLWYVLSPTTCSPTGVWRRGLDAKRRIVGRPCVAVYVNRVMRKKVD